MIYFKPNLDFPRVFVACTIASTHVTVRTFAPMLEESCRNADGTFAMPLATAGWLDQRLEQPADYFPRKNATHLIPGQHLQSALQGQFYTEHSAVSLIKNDNLGSGEWTDCARWVFGVDNEGTLRTPYNAILDTFASKAPPIRSFTDRGINSVVHVCVPFKDASFGDANVLVFYHPDFGFKINDVGQPYPDSLTLTDLLPHVVLDGPTTMMGEAEVRVRVLDYNQNVCATNSELYLEPVSGYVPHARVPLTNGESSFRVSSWGLRKGEKVRVKVGWRYWSGAAEYSATVV